MPTKESLAPYKNRFIQLPVHFGKLVSFLQNPTRRGRERKRERESESERERERESERGTEGGREKCGYMLV
jgi:hypothetical protein